MVKVSWIILTAGISVASQAVEEEMVKAKSGQMIPWSRFDPKDLGERKVEYSGTGIRKLNRVPKVGIHPRVFFGPDDLPEHRRVLKETRMGREAWLNILAWSDWLNGEYDLNADYAVKDAGGKPYPDPLRNARVPLVRGRTLPGTYAKLTTGEMVEDDFFIAVSSLEAFRCLIEDDAQRAKKLAAALSLTVQNRLGEMAGQDASGVVTGNVTVWQNVSLAYDFIYNYMTDDQRDVVRRGIASLIKGRAAYGTFLAPEATTSNWTTLDSFLLWTALGIEGEEGYDARFYKGYVRAFRNYMTYGFYPSGADLEGLGKNYQFITSQICMAMRGSNVIQHPHVKAFGTRFLPHMVQPFGNSFIGHDDWGGTGWDSIAGGYRFNLNDAIGFKWMMPNDPAVDFVFRNWMGGDYEQMRGDVRPDGYYNAPLLFAIFPSDFSEKEPDPEFLGNTFFCGLRGLMGTRSGWDKDALYFQLTCRQNAGGHAHADKNNFTLSGLGRIWVHWRMLSGGGPLGVNTDTHYHSNILIDDIGQSGNGVTVHRTPGKVVAFEDQPLATFVCGDAKNAYDWQWGGAGPGWYLNHLRDKPGSEPVMETPNDFTFTKQKDSIFDQPYKDFPHWLRVGESTQVFRRPWNPVQKAFRTAGLVRGKHNYVIVFDDVQKDDAVHNYKWLMQISDDLEIANKQVGFSYDEKQGTADILLSCNDSERNANDPFHGRNVREGDRVLLVRILNYQPDRSSPHRSSPIGHIEQYVGDPRWMNPGKRLVLPTWAVSPDYRILLFLHRHGDPLPTTEWSSDRNHLKVAWEGQEDVYSFSLPDTDSRTTFSLSRNGKPILEFK